MAEEQQEKEVASLKELEDYYEKKIQDVDKILTKINADIETTKNSWKKFSENVMGRNHPAIQIAWSIITKTEYKADVANDKEEVYKMLIEDLKEIIKKDYVPKYAYEEKVEAINKKIAGLNVNDAAALGILLDSDIKNHNRSTRYAMKTGGHASTFHECVDRIMKAVSDYVYYKEERVKNQKRSEKAERDSDELITTRTNETKTTGE